MAAIAYPAYGTLMTSDYSEAPVQNMYRTEMEAGYAKQAARTSLNLIQRQVRYLYTNAEFITFKTFVDQTADKGASFFDWASPVDGVTRDTRIVNGIYNASPVTPSMTHWFVTMSFESYE